MAEAAVAMPVARMQAAWRHAPMQARSERETDDDSGEGAGLRALEHGALSRAPVAGCSSNSAGWQ